MYLENIHSPREVKQLNITQLEQLASEIRSALLSKVSVCGGHVGPNLGMVELTIALHYVFESPKDKIIYDVSHQTYVHKMLTGRKHAFLDAHQYHTISAYANPEESEHDFFWMGHTSTSLSLACGLAKARDLNNQKENIIAVIGDGSLSGGEAYEGLNNIAQANKNTIIIVNDNEMSIAENYGGLYQNLALLRQTNGAHKNNFFTSLGLQYCYIEDGHHLQTLIDTLTKIKDQSTPIVVHIHTTKGKGYEYAQKDKETWHYSAPFDIKKGHFIKPASETYASITRDFVYQTIQQNTNTVAITSGTPGIFEFDKKTRERLGDQFIDVGIAEKHAIAYTSALAGQNATPIYAVYSTFLQRTYDQISHDLCLNNNPATVLVYSASIYGMNDKTHLGIFDIGMLSNIPNLVYLAPSSKEEHLAMLQYATTQKSHPVFIRVPATNIRSTNKKVVINEENVFQYNIEKQGKDVAIITFSNFYELAEQIVSTLAKQFNINATFITAKCLSHLDKEQLSSLLVNHKLVVTMEDGILEGGLGDRIASFYAPTAMRVENFGIKKGFPDRYDINRLLQANKITKEDIIERIINQLKQ